MSNATPTAGSAPVCALSNGRRLSRSRNRLWLITLEASTMRFKLSQLCLALAVGSLALAANAQPTGSASSGAAATRGSHGASAAPSSKATRPHSAKRSSAMHKRQVRERGGPMNEANAADSAYKAALRRCVTGPQSSRESCLDQAIAQYGHA
jgi:hypothetical protein